jgi:tRNA 2-thiouridine synthesizing protein A
LLNSSLRQGSWSANRIARSAHGAGFAKVIEVEEETMSEIDLTTVKASKVVDCRGSACPGPLLEAKKAIGTVSVGQVLEIWSNDSGTKRDIPLWAKKVGHEPIGTLDGEGYDRIFVVRKK